MNINKYNIINGMNVKNNYGISHNDPNFCMALDEYGIYIIKENEKHGIVSVSRENVILPIEYDDIFLVYRCRINDTNACWYTVQKDGKAGLYAISFFTLYDDDNQKYYIYDVSLKTVIDCECDYIYPYGRCFILSDGNGFRYLIADCDDDGAIYRVSNYYKRILQADSEEKYIHAYDDVKHRIIKIDPWEDDVTVFETSVESNCYGYEYIGSDNFVNYYNGHLLIKDKKPIKFRARNITPISFVGDERKTNIANIIKVSYETGLVGAVDNKGDVLFEPEYDEISYELKLTAIKDGEKIEKVIPIGVVHRDKIKIVPIKEK